MSHARKLRRFTPEEYYLIEAQADSRSEYFNGEIFAMAGASLRHNRISGNIFLCLGNKLKGTPCVPYGSDLKLRVKATGLRTYPDISVFCGKPELDPDDPARQTYMNPILLAEVLSPTTLEYDRSTKSSHYRRIESLKINLLVFQDEAHVEAHIWQPDGTWSLREYTGLDQTLSLDAIGVDLPLAEIYEGVDFTTDE